MARPKKIKRKGPGRPRREPMSGAELRQKALEGMQKSAEARGVIDYTAAEESLSVMLDEKRLKQSTQAELKELRRMAERLWDKLQIEKEYEEDMEWSYGVRREPTEQSEAWDAEHEFLKPKRKNAKKIKNIHTLTDKQKLAKGMALEPVQSEFDIEMTEADLEEVLMQEARLRMEREKQHVKGRRLTGRTKTVPAAKQANKFWN